MADVEKVIKEAEDELKLLAQDEKHRRHMGIMMRLGWIYDVLDMLKEQPKIVRCKDCKYRGSEIRSGIEFAKCKLRHNWMPQDDWFCADGERNKAE